MHYYEAVPDPKDRSPKVMAEFMRVGIDDI
jgi:hypothetical protein